MSEIKVRPAGRHVAPVRRVPDAGRVMHGPSRMRSALPADPATRPIPIDERLARSGAALAAALRAGVTA